jgi:drug/metabolite transporter (DMT)-like permease
VSARAHRANWPASVRKASLLPFTWMLLGSFSFAWMGTTAYALARSCDWQVVALARSSLALVFAALLARAAGARLVLWKPPILWVRSIAGSVSLVCTFYAFTHLPQTYVLTLTSTFPIWVALLSWLLYRRRPPLQVWLSVASSVIGVALVSPYLPAASGDGPAPTYPAMLAALTGSFATAIAMLGLHRLHDLDARVIVVHFSGVAVLFCLGSFLVSDHLPNLSAVLQGPTPLLLLVLGLTATVGQICLTRAFVQGPPTKVAVVNLTQIVFALLLDVWLWDQSFKPGALLGMSLVVAPSAWMMAGRSTE